MIRRLDSQETELRGLRVREDGGLANRYGGEGNKGKPPVFAVDRVMTFNDWNFKFKSYMGNISAPLMQGMGIIEHKQDVLEDFRFHRGAVADGGRIVLSVNDVHRRALRSAWCEKQGPMMGSRPTAGSHINIAHRP